MISIEMWYITDSICDDTITFLLRFMNTTIRLTTVLLGVLLTSPAKAAPSTPVVTERGPHHRLWQRTTEIMRRDGKLI